MLSSMTTTAVPTAMRGATAARAAAFGWFVRMSWNPLRLNVSGSFRISRSVGRGEVLVPDLRVGSWLPAVPAWDVYGTSEPLGGGEDLS